MTDQRKSYWYAFVTKPRHEKCVNERLHDAGMQVYLPMQEKMRQWKDRKKIIKVPLFSCYIFVHIPFIERYEVLKVPSVVRIVSIGTEPSPVRNEEITAIQRILESDVYFKVGESLAAGDRVKIDNGPLRDIEGDLVYFRGTHRLAVNIEALGKSLIVDIDRRAVSKVCCLDKRSSEVRKRMEATFK